MDCTCVVFPHNPLKLSFSNSCTKVAMMKNRAPVKRVHGEKRMQWVRWRGTLCARASIRTYFRHLRTCTNR